MAARSRKRFRDRNAYGDYEDGSTTEQERTSSLPRQKRKRRRRPVLWISLFTLLFLGVALAPTIIGMTPLGPSMIASAAKGQINGTLEVQRVSLGWFSPVVMHGVTLRDTAGVALGKVKSITLRKSILGLLSDMHRLDTIEIEEPQLRLVVNPDSSNLENWLAPLLKQPASTAPLPEFKVLVKDGTFDLVDGTNDRTWQFSPLSAEIASPRDGTPAWEVKLDGKQEQATFMAELKQATVASTSEAPLRIDLQTERFPLETLQPILNRVLGPTQVAGLLTGKMSAGFDAAYLPHQVHFDRVETEQFRFAAASLLGKDELRLMQGKAHGGARYANGVWQLQDLELESDVAALAGQGDVRVADFTSGNALPQTDCDVRGVIDLARLVQLFPQTLRVREGVEIVSGRANVMLVSHAAGAGRRFEVSLTTEDLQARHHGQLVAIQEPLSLGAILTQTKQGWSIEKLDAKSSFLNADITGTPAAGKLAARGDLQRLREELARFFDLGDVKLAGSLAVDVNWETNAEQLLKTAGELRFTRMALEFPGMLPWNEDDLHIQFSGEAIRPQWDQFAMGGGSVMVESAQDRLTAKLVRPVGSLSEPVLIPIELELTGNLATWTPRLQAFLPLGDYRLSGPVKLTATANVGATRVEIPRTDFNVQQLRLQGEGLLIQEPVVQGEAQVTWDATASALTLSQLLVQSTSVAIASEQMLVQTGADAKITGQTVVRGDVGKLMSWFDKPGISPQIQYFGELESELKFTHVNGATRAQLLGQLGKVAVARRAIPVAANRLTREVSSASGWQTVWSEQLVTFGGEAAYDAATDTIRFNNMQTKMGTSLVTTSGTIQHPSQNCLADLTGEVRYDLASIAPLTRPYLGETFDIRGITSKPFELKGPLFETNATVVPADAPLFPSGLVGRAGVNWEAVTWMSLEMGGADLVVDLKDSILSLQPAKIPLSQGTVNLSPSIMMRGPRWMLTQEETKLIDHVVITPEMCNTWIKYIQPLLSEATQAQGQFSLDVEKAVVPLDTPAFCNAKGVFTVHQVGVGPGPLAERVIGLVRELKSFADGKTGVDALLGLAGAGLNPMATPATPPVTTPSKSWLELPEQQVAIDVVQGRVHHQGLTMKIDDVLVKTSGSVGIADQSLSLVLEMAIKDDWIKNKRELAFLKGQTIQIPITGTISNFQLDTRSLVALGKNQVFNAGRTLLENEVTRGLEKGTGAVQSEVGKVQNKLQEEVQKGKQKLESELRDGLKGIFGS